MKLNRKLLYIILVVLFLIGGFVLFKILKTQSSARVVNNFEKCAKAGYPILESYPRQCRTPDGKTFTEKLTPEEKERTTSPLGACENLCGDETCQEVVCMALGCPCAESPKTCPQDCK